MCFKLSMLLFFSTLVVLISADEGQFSINYNKAVQILNEKFVSFTVDPAIFFAGLSNRPVVLNLLRNLSPAYLRIAGSSTQFLEFNADERKATKSISDDSSMLTFSPAMWWSLNEWIQKTNFTPIFAINDEGGAEEKWNSNTVSPLLDMTAKMNINCLWQLGFDCSKKGFENYKDDLKTFRELLNKFPKKKDKWQIVGSDLSKCTPSDNSEILRMYLADLQEADAIIWDQEETASSKFLSGSVMQTLLSFHEASMPIWLSTPKCVHPITFDDGINWAIEMGEAAKNGFSVIFREPRLQEYYSATPAYWVTVLHKNLMGRNVLDVKKYNEAFVYAHCSRDQNSFSVRGAMTLMIVNNSTDLHKAAFRLPTQIKSIEVRSYILSTKESTMDTYLNGEKLNVEDFKLLPKLRRAKVLTHLMLTVPPKSIGFFVLPGAKIPICIDNEDDTQLILQEIDKIQEIDFSESTGKAEGLFSRLKASRVSLSLADLRRKFEEEFKTDSGLIPKLKLKSQAVVNDDWKQQLTKSTTKSDVSQKTGFLDESNARINEMKKFLEKAKSVDFKNLLKKEDEKKEEILGSSLNVLGAKPKLDIDLSTDEILRILGDRAKAKLEQKMGFQDFEFDGFLDRALGRKFKRGINMALLEEKVHDQEKHAKLPSMIKKTKKLEKLVVAPNSEELDGLPDMSKIIPGHEKASKMKAALSESSIFGKKPAVLPKLDIFGIEPLDISSLLSLLGNKASTSSISTSTTRPSVKVNKKSELYDAKHDFDMQMSELEDNLNGHGSFFDHFGDSVIVQPKHRNHEFHGLGESWDFDDGLMDNHEFIINDENDIQETIQKLEKYFNAKPRLGHPLKVEISNEYFEPALDSLETFGNRFKRSVAIDDIMKSIKQRRLNKKLLKSNEKLKLSSGLTRNKKKLFPRDISDKQSKINGYQKAFLRTRLALESNPISKAFPKSRFNLLKRQPRSHQERINLQEVYHPKSNITNNIIKNYESKLSPKEWRPEDILNLPQLHSIYEINERKQQIAFDDIPNRQASEKINTRRARHVDGDINSMENAIDDFLNTIEKDKTFIKPLLDSKDGEYMIVLPTREKLSLQQDKNGDTEIILHRESGKMSVSNSGVDGSGEGGEKDSDQVDSRTCAATDLYDDDTLEKLRRQNGIAKDIVTTDANDGNIGWRSEDEAIRDEDGEDNDDAKEKRVDRSEYVQKIPAKAKTTKEGDDNMHNKLDFVTKIVSGFSRFCRKLHTKVKSFFKEQDE